MKYFCHPCQRKSVYLLVVHCASRATAITHQNTVRPNTNDYLIFNIFKILIACRQQPEIKLFHVCFSWKMWRTFTSSAPTISIRAALPEFFVRRSDWLTQNYLSQPPNIDNFLLTTTITTLLGLLILIKYIWTIWAFYNLPYICYQFILYSYSRK